MKTTTLQNELIEYGKTQKGAEVYFREDWECYYFSLLGKSFGMMNDELITLKGNPQDNTFLRDTYKDIVPGYYANKVHWNSIYLATEEIDIETFKDFIDTSYALVYQGLTKKNQKLVHGQS